jgi:peptidyl-prolyl cis-trans isomerase D
MAVLGRIRNATGLMLIVVLGATAAFVLGDLFSGASRGTPTVGSINGEEIQVQEYQNLVGKYEAINPNGSRTGAENQAWNDLTFKYAWLPRIEDDGLVVLRDPEGDDETIEEFDMMQGRTLHKTFFNQNSQNLPHTEFVDQFSGIISNILEGGPSAQNKSYGLLMRQKENFYSDRLRDKYTSLFTNTTYVTTAEARRKLQGQGSISAKATFQYLYLPFSGLQDSTVVVSESDMESYIGANPNEFKVKDSRSLAYVALSYKASAADKNALLVKANELTMALSGAENAQEFINLNSDVQSTIILKEYNDLPNQLKSDSASIAEGKVYGPFFTGNRYQSFKVNQVRSGEGIFKTSFSAILVDTSRIADDKVDAALDSASQLLLVAISTPEDPSLSWSPATEIESIDSLQLPKGVIEKLFSSAEVGVHPELLTVPAGVLIIKRNEGVSAASTKYGVAALDLDLIPSQVTRDSVWEIASILIADSKDFESFVNAVDSNKTIRLENADNLQSTASDIGRYSGSDVKAIVSWSFQNEINTIGGDVYDIADQEIYIVAIKGASEEDVVTVDAVRSKVNKKVQGQKKALVLKEMLKAQNGKDFSTAASSINSSNPGLAIVNTSENVTLGNKYIPNFSFGYEPKMIGAAFGLEKNTLSSVLVGDQGVFLVKVIDRVEGGDKKDYSEDKSQFVSAQKYSQVSKLNQAIQELTDISDQRFK